MYFFSISAQAEIRKIKIDPKLQIKFNDKEWNYQFIQVLSTISPHIFESKTNSEVKVVIQKETHTDASSNKNNLVQKKCEEADKFYKQTGQGFAKNIKIKTQNVCLIQFAKSEKTNYQIIYPVQFNKSGYELLSFAWQSKNSETVKEVSSLVSENL